MLPPYLFALIAETTLVTNADLYVMARAIEAGTQDCARAWGKKAPAVDVFEARMGLPQFCQPVVFLDDTSDPGALAVHYWDPVRLQPAARVWSSRSSSLFDGSGAQSVAASHEVLEALGDPSCEADCPCPGRPGVRLALELCDPVQDELVVRMSNGPVAVANYVLPAYFDEELADPEMAKIFLEGGGRFDAKGTLTRAGQIGPRGYAILSDDSRTWFEGPDGELKFSEDSAKLHPWARTERRRKHLEMARRKVTADG